MARARRHHLCRLYSWLSLGHQRLDPSRRRDHQVRIAARYPRVLLPHAFARFGRPQGLLQNRTWMDPDMNKYDLNHRVAHHSKMSDAEWEDAYRMAWASYYTPEHARTIFRRTAACIAPSTSIVRKKNATVHKVDVSPAKNNIGRSACRSRSMDLQRRRDHAA